MHGASNPCGFGVQNLLVRRQLPRTRLLGPVLDFGCDPATTPANQHIRESVADVRTVHDVRAQPAPQPDQPRVVVVDLGRVTPHDSPFITMTPASRCRRSVSTKARAMRSQRGTGSGTVNRLRSSRMSWQWVQPYTASLSCGFRPVPPPLNIRRWQSCTCSLLGPG